MMRSQTYQRNLLLSEFYFRHFRGKYSFFPHFVFEYLFYFHRHGSSAQDVNKREERKTLGKRERPRRGNLRINFIVNLVWNLVKMRRPLFPSVISVVLLLQCLAPDVFSVTADYDSIDMMSVTHNLR